MMNRRNLVMTGAVGALSLGFAPRIAFARAAGARRLVFILQRGAADGLATVAPVGDPAFAGQRGVLAEEFDAGHRLDAMFALHPNLRTVAQLYAGQQALFVHAVASPYRDRSHFDAQNVIESGGLSAYQLKDGWMNRLLGLMPDAERRGIAVAATIPLALRGRVEVASYAPSALPDASDDLLGRVSALYAPDRQLHAIWEQAMATRALTGDLAANGGRNAAATGALAARLLAAENGARVAMIETGGWDTHAGQRGRLGGQLNGLDQMIAALKDGLGPVWGQTLVLVATEFGRTVKVNGTQGTDHGTASVAWLLGGAVRGGRVVADWPGLSDAALYEGRDLRPTMALDSVIAGAAADHFGIDPARAMATLFPGQAARAMDGLIRA